MISCTVGLDMVEIGRVEKSLRLPGFIKRVYSRKEQEFLESRGYAPRTAAANFCAKEAFSKALGTGIRGFSLAEVSLLRDSLGKPYLVLEGSAKEIAEKMGLSFSVSVTHTKEFASVVVIGWSEEEPCGLPESQSH